LEVFEKRVLRRIYYLKRWVATGEWRKLQNEKLHTLCTSPNIIMDMQYFSRKVRREKATWQTQT
jgi:hypothetical protein